MRPHYALLLFAPVAAACGSSGTDGAADSVPPSSSVVDVSVSSSVDDVALTPEPFGPAANGIVLYGSTTGDIVAVDPVSGVTTVVIAGETDDDFPHISPDGTQFLFERQAPTGPEIWIATVDGSDPRAVVTGGRRLGWVEWSPDGELFATVAAGGGDPTLYDAASGESTVLDAEVRVDKLAWLPDGRLLLVTVGEQGRADYRAASGDGSNVEPLPVAPDAIGEFSLSNDGTRLAYQTWTADAASGHNGRVHVLDLATGIDTVVDPDDEAEWQSPLFSPDGRWLKVDRYDASDKPLQVALLATDGSTSSILLGEPMAVQDETFGSFAPDSSQVLVTYPDATTYLFDVATGAGEPVGWPDVGLATSWQRLPTG